MTSEVNSSFVGILASYVGASEPALRLLLSVLLGKQ